MNKAPKQKPDRSSDPENQDEVFALVHELEVPVGRETQKTLDEIEDLKNQKEKAKLDDLLQDIDLRKRFSKATLWLVGLWLAFMGLILLIQGFVLWSFNLGGRSNKCVKRKRRCTLSVNY